MSNLYSAELSDSAGSFGLEILETSDDLLLAWFSRRFGVYGICRWVDKEQDWFIASSLVESEEYSIDFLGMFNRERHDDGTAFLKLLSLMMASGQVEPAAEISLSEVAQGQELFPQHNKQKPISMPTPNYLSTEWHKDFFTRLANWAHYQRITHQTQEIVNAIPDLEIFNAGGAVPFQAYGSWEGNLFYFRYRHGRASLSIGGEDPIGAPRWSAAVAYGDPMSGFLSLQEFYYLFYVLGEKLTDAPQPYVFQELGGEEPRDRTVFGFSETEAHERIKDLTSTWATPGEDIQVQLISTPPEYPPGSRAPQLLAPNPFTHYATEGAASDDTPW